MQQIFIEAYNMSAIFSKNWSYKNKQNKIFDFVEQTFGRKTRQ